MRKFLSKRDVTWSLNKSKVSFFHQWSNKCLLDGSLSIPIRPSWYFLTAPIWSRNWWQAFWQTAIYKETNLGFDCAVNDMRLLEKLRWSLLRIPGKQKALKWDILSNNITAGCQGHAPSPIREKGWAGALPRACDSMLWNCFRVSAGVLRVLGNMIATIVTRVFRAATRRLSSTSLDRHSMRPDRHSMLERWL